MPVISSQSVALRLFCFKDAMLDIFVLKVKDPCEKTLQVLWEGVTLEIRKPSLARFRTPGLGTGDVAGLGALGLRCARAATGYSVTPESETLSQPQVGKWKKLLTDQTTAQNHRGVNLGGKNILDHTPPPVLSHNPAQGT